MVDAGRSAVRRAVGDAVVVHVRPEVDVVRHALLDDVGDADVKVGSGQLHRSQGGNCLAGRGFFNFQIEVLANVRIEVGEAGGKVTQVNRGFTAGVAGGDE